MKFSSIVLEIPYYNSGNPQLHFWKSSSEILNLFPCLRMNSIWDRVWGGPCLSNLDCTDYISICFISTPGIGDNIIKLYSTALLVYSSAGVGKRYLYFCTVLKD